MNSDKSIPAASLSADDRQKCEERARARLALMGKLCTSLSGSCEALLALDLGGITRGTREQVGLSLQLASAMAQENQRRFKDKLLAEKQAAPHFAASVSVLEPTLEAEIRASQDRVWHALRLQSAILGRARAKLRVLANALAGPSVNYGPPAARGGGLRQPQTFAGNPGGEI
ncbi:MAG: hypothetical protein WBM24_20155 [Candidatus Sulfotelmatobacter sp.]